MDSTLAPEMAFSCQSLVAILSFATLGSVLSDFFHCGQRTGEKWLERSKNLFWFVDSEVSVHGQPVLLFLDHDEAEHHGGEEQSSFAHGNHEAEKEKDRRDKM
jgi:hypothetical protein